MANQRQYWIVSPNVKNVEKEVEHWKKEIVQGRAAIMGWPPDDYGHSQIGPKFAGETQRSIQPGDIVLVARSHKGRPDIVGFGAVNGVWKPVRLAPHDDDVYVRGLEPFKGWKEGPTGIHLADFLNHTKALVQLHPAENHAHKRLCQWMEHQLRVAPPGSNAQSSGSRLPIGSDADLLTDPYSRYTEARKQIVWRNHNRLSNRFRAWLRDVGATDIEAESRSTDVVCSYHGSRYLFELKVCDQNESHRALREALGQLLDYAYYPGRQRIDRLGIVIEHQPSKADTDWISSLTEAFGMTLDVFCLRNGVFCCNGGAHTELATSASAG